jgi:hypothetical protein
MCAHSSSGAEITEKIGEKLYPFISKLFQEVINFERDNFSDNEESALSDRFYELKSQFESLCNYEVKLVFPSVLGIFNTKDKLGYKPNVNILELQKLTQNKERLILALVKEIKEQAELSKISKQHPIYSLFFVFENSFDTEKRQWNNMLNGWNLGCACFAAAQNHQL